MPRVLMLERNEPKRDPRVRRAVRTLKAAGWDVTVACQLWQPLGRGAKAHEVWDGIGIQRFGLRSMWRGSVRRVVSGADTPAVPSGSLARSLARFAAFVWDGFALAWRMRGQRFNVCHAHDLDTLLAGMLLATTRGRPLVYDAHELVPDQTPNPPRLFRRLLLALEKLLAERVSCLVTVSTSLARILNERGRFRATVVVRNCPDLPNLDRASPVRHHGRMRVVYQGAFQAHRGIEELIASVRHARGWELYLRGVGPLEEHLRHLGSCTASKEHVRFLPAACPEDLVESLFEFDVGVVSYQPVTLNNRYCLPNKVYEYMAGGLALATSDLPELRTLISEEKNGVCFDPFSPESIAAVLNELSRSRPRLWQARWNSFQAARRTYNWQFESRKLLGLYHALAVTRRAVC